MSTFAIQRQLFRPTIQLLKRNYHHDHQIPAEVRQATMDEFPVPKEPWQAVYNRNQTKYNKYLAISSVIFLATILSVFRHPKVDLNLFDYSLPDEN